MEIFGQTTWTTAQLDAPSLYVLLVSLIQFPWFSESLETDLSKADLSNDVFNSGTKICHFSALDHGLYIHNPLYGQIGKYFLLSNIN